MAFPHCTVFIVLYRIVLYLLYCIGKSSYTCCSILECRACLGNICRPAIIIGITHVFFHVLTSAGSRGSCLNTRPMGRVFKDLPRDLASVDAMKQTCVIVILAYFTFFQPNLH